MEATKAKRPVRRSTKSISSPVPTGPVGGTVIGGGTTCGHSGCETACRVRYVGPVSSMRDHHIVHAARGVAHVWSAAIVAGLAVVLTGAIAYTAVQADTAASQASDRATLQRQLSQMNSRLDRIEQAVYRR